MFMKEKSYYHMKNISAIFASVFAVFVFSGNLLAQDINPTVEVSRDFKGALKEIHKSALKPSSMDSSLISDLHFSYSVLSRKYGSGYDFAPGKFGAQNISSRLDEPLFMLDLSAGYPLTTGASFTLRAPVKGGFSLSAYGSHDGYFSTADLMTFGTSPVAVRGVGSYKSHFMDNKAGIAGRYGWKSGELYFDLGYVGAYGRDTLLKRNQNSFHGVLGTRSRRADGSHFHYDVRLGYDYVSDRTSIFPDVSALWMTPADVSENHFTFDAVAGPVFGKYHSVLVGLGLDLSDNSGSRDLMMMVSDIIPEYRFSKGRWRFGLGVHFSITHTSETLLQGGSYKPSGKNPTNWIFPKADVKFEAVRRHLWLYAGADGGNRLNRYTEQARKYHFLITPGDLSVMQDYTVSPYRFYLGLSGSAGARFSFDLHGKYGRVRGLPVFSMFNSLYPVMTYGLSTDYLGAVMSMRFRSQDVDAGVDMEYDWFFIKHGNGEEVLPAPFKGNAYVSYNWRQRLYLTLTADFESRTEPSKFVLPGYVSLGFRAEYWFSSSWGVSLQGTNLLNQPVMFMPLHTAPGLTVSGGVSLRL